MRHGIKSGQASLLAAGVVTADEARAVLSELLADPALPTKPRIFCDLRLVTLLELETPDLRQLIQLGGAGPDFMIGARVAVVAHSDHVYGMARMLQAMVLGQPFELRVFRQAPEAGSWLHEPG